MSNQCPLHCDDHRLGHSSQHHHHHQQHKEDISLDYGFPSRCLHNSAQHLDLFSKPWVMPFQMHLFGFHPAKHLAIATAAFHLLVNSVKLLICLVEAATNFEGVAQRENLQNSSNYCCQSSS